MRILLVNTLYPPLLMGGAERSVSLLAEALARAGHEPWVLSLTPENREQRQEIRGVRILRIPTPNRYFPYPKAPPPAPQRLLWHLRDTWNPQVSSRFRQILREIRPAVVHTNLLVGFSVALWQAVRAEGIPLVHTLRDYYLLCPRSTMFKNGRNCSSICWHCRPFSLPRRRASAWVDAVVGVSRFILQRHQRFGYFPKARAFVVPNAVEARAPGTAPNPPGSPLRLGFMGRLVPAKGIELLLRVFHELQGLPLELWIAGQGEPSYEQTLKARYARDPRIRWLGFVSPAEILGKIAVLVVPSLWHEPMGRVVVEAYAWGVPVVAARRGGLPEVVQEGRTGFLFEPDRPEELGQLLRHLAERPETLVPLQRQAQAYSQDFTVERMRDRYLEIYEQQIP